MDLLEGGDITRYSGDIGRDVERCREAERDRLWAEGGRWFLLTDTSLGVLYS